MRSYRERLRVPLWWHLGSLVFALVIGGEAVLSTRAAVAVPILLAFGLLAEAFLWKLGRTSVEVTGGRVRAGRWRLPLTQVRGVALLDARQMRAELNRGEGDVYRCTAPWVRAGVLLDVDDPDDLPLWLVSSRDPRALALALADAAALPDGGVITAGPAAAGGESAAG